jgi:hypothetical protein
MLIYRKQEYVCTLYNTSHTLALEVLEELTGLPRRETVVQYDVTE